MKKILKNFSYVIKTPQILIPLLKLVRAPHDNNHFLCSVQIRMNAI